ncbi:MAG: DUF1801 domain-containing protein [Leeuwenhoekiella sp.]
MSQNKTQPTDASPLTFLESVDHKKRKEDSLELLELFNSWLDEKPVMWGESIIGYGKYTYNYDSGRSGDWFYTGFSPRKQYLAVYLMTGFKPFKEELKKLGKHKTSSSCLYINKLEDINIKILEKMILKCVKIMKTSQ